MPSEVRTRVLISNTYVYTCTYVYLHAGADACEILSMNAARASCLYLDRSDPTDFVELVPFGVGSSCFLTSERSLRNCAIVQCSCDVACFL